MRVPSRRREVEEPQRATRRVTSTYIIRNLRCALCGAKYHGGVDGFTGRRYYAHPSPKGVHSMDRQTQGRALEAECRTFRVLADTAEEALKDLILKERDSPDWAMTMRRLFAESAANRGGATRLLEQMERKVRVAEEALDSNLTALDRAKGRTLDIILKRVEEKHPDLETARRDLEAAHARVRASGDSAERASRMLTETLQIAQAWNSEDVSARQRILNWWVDGVYVMPNRPVHRLTRTDKTLLVWLATCPDTPKEVALGGTAGVVGPTCSKCQRCGRSSAHRCRCGG
jgi:hypothetical protein